MARARTHAALRSMRSRATRAVADSRIASASSDNTLWHAFGSRVAAGRSFRAGGSARPAPSRMLDGSDRTGAWRGDPVAPVASTRGGCRRCHTSFHRAGALGEREQRIGRPVDARNAGKRVVDRGRQRADRDLDHLRDTELAVLGERTVTADANAMIDCCQHMGLVGRDDDRERLSARHELARAEPKHDQCIRGACRCDQCDVIDVLQVAALGTQQDRARLGLAQTRQMYTNVAMNRPIVNWVTQSCRKR